MRLRDALVPYIYSYGLMAYRTGVSLLQPMYYDWPSQDAAYAYPGQYLFGADILVAPVTTPSSVPGGPAPKTVYLPPLAHASEWLSFLEGLPATQIPGSNSSALAEGGSVMTAMWALHEMPLFVRPGTILPTRSMNSTHMPFVDPLIWLAWVGSGTSELYEDAGDGLDYTNPDPASDTYAITRASMQCDLSSNTSVVFSVAATQGRHPGQQQSREQRVQFRGVGNNAPARVEVNGALVHSITPQEPGPGWYISEGGAEGEELLEPKGALVVKAGRPSIAATVSVEVIFS